MKVALVHYSAPPVIGGVESVMAAHARLLRGAGHDVIVIAGRGDAELVPELDSRHPEVEALASELAEGRAGSEFQRLREVLTAKLEPLTADRDVVVAHNVLTMPFNLPAAAALTSLGRPLVAWTHDLAWINPQYEAYRRDGEPWSLLRTPQPRTTYVTVSETRAEELASLMGIRPASVPNGLDTAGLAGLDQSTRDLVDRLELLRADPLLLCPQRITPRKRIELAIEAAAVIGSKEANLKLVVSGPLGPHSTANASYAEGLRNLAAHLRCQDKVIFMHQLQSEPGVHPVSDEQIGGLFRLADAVVLPSSSEGFGLPVLEAGLAGTPIVCADLPVLREVSGGDAWFYPADAGPQALAEVIGDALESRGGRLRRRARRHDWARLLPQIESVLERAASA